MLELFTGPCGSKEANLELQKNDNSYGVPHDRFNKSIL